MSFLIGTNGHYSGLSSQGIIEGSNIKMYDLTPAQITLIRAARASKRE